MVRKSWLAAGVVLALTVASGCANRDRPGLLSRFRARSAMPECCPNGHGYESGGFGAANGIPCSNPNPCPCTTMPGSIINGGTDVIVPQPPFSGIPPMAPATPPNSATPGPAGPSGDPMKLPKGTGGGAKPT